MPVLHCTGTRTAYVCAALLLVLLVLLVLLLLQASPPHPTAWCVVLYCQVVEVLPPEADSSIQMITEKPDVTYDVRSCDWMWPASNTSFLTLTLCGGCRTLVVWTFKSKKSVRQWSCH